MVTILDHVDIEESNNTISTNPVLKVKATPGTYAYESAFVIQEGNMLTVCCCLYLYG